METFNKIFNWIDSILLAAAEFSLRVGWYLIVAVLDTLAGD